MHEIAKVQRMVICTQRLILYLERGSALTVM